jgi:AraC family transcriptional regulator
MRASLFVGQPRMAHPSPRAEYDKRMHRVLAYIDAHLDQPLDLATLADVAHFSPYHFHRLFTAWMGDTLGDHLRRRRVEAGAQRLLLQPNLTVLAAALSVGFGSGEAFARAFKLRFDASPTAWRAQQRNLDQAQRKLDQAITAGQREDGTPLPPTLEMTMKYQVTLADRPAVPVAYLRHVGPYGDAVGLFWQKEFHPWRQQHGLQNQPCYGIGHDDPTVTEAAKCRYDACTEYPADFLPPRQMLTTTLAGGKHAVMPFEGTSQTIGDAWGYLLRHWLPDSGYQIANGPCFEHYQADAKYDAATGQFSCELCIPLAPL